MITHTFSRMVSKEGFCILSQQSLRPRVHHLGPCWAAPALAPSRKPEPAGACGIAFELAGAGRWGRSRRRPGGKRNPHLHASSQNTSTVRPPAGQPAPAGPSRPEASEAFESDPILPFAGGSPGSAAASRLLQPAPARQARPASTSGAPAPARARRQAMRRREHAAAVGVAGEAGRHDDAPSMRGEGALQVHAMGHRDELQRGLRRLSWPARNGMVSSRERSHRNQLWHRNERVRRPVAADNFGVQCLGGAT